MKILKNILKGLGYLLFFVFCTLLFVRMLFPTDQAKEFIAQRVAEATGAESVKIGDLGLTGIIPNGVELEKLAVTLPGIKVKTPERGGVAITDPRTINVDHMTLKSSLATFTGGPADVTVEAKIGAGTVRGAHYTREKGGPHVLKIEAIENIPLSSERLFQTLFGLDITGKLSGKVDLTIPTVEHDGKTQPAFDQMAGRVEIQLANAKVLQPIFDTPQGRMQLSDVDLGQVRLAIVADGPAAAGPAPQTGDPKARPPKARDATLVTIEEAVIEGPELQVLGAPRSTITFVAGGGPKEAALNIHMALKIEDALIDKQVDDPKNPGKMTKPNIGLRYMLGANPIKSQIVDGQFGVGITGTIGEAKPKTEKPRAKIGGGAGPARKMNLDHPEEGGEEGHDEGKKPREPKETPKPAVVTPPTDVPSRRPGMARPLTPHTPPTPPGTAAVPGRPRPVIPTDGAPGESLEGGENPTPAPTAPTPEPGAPAPPPEGELVVPEGGAVDPAAPVEPAPQ